MLCHLNVIQRLLKGTEHVLRLKQLVHQLGLLERSRQNNMYVAFYARVEPLVRGQGGEAPLRAESLLESGKKYIVQLPFVKYHE